MQSGALEHHRSARDTTRHLEYWQERFGKYALVHLTPHIPRVACGSEDFLAINK